MPIVDFHIHVYDRPLQAPRAFIEFFDRQVGGSFEEFVETRHTADHYVAYLDESGVDYGVVLAEQAPLTSGHASNETVRRLCAGSPRLIPFASLNPHLTPDPARELRRLVTEDGFRGLKLYPTYEYFYPNDAMLYPIYAVAQELGIPVMWHTGSSVFPASRIKYGDPLYIDDVAVDFPDLTAIITHGGRPFWYDRAYALCRFRERVYMDISGLPPQRLLTYFPELPRVADKVVFGTDWPSIADVRKNIATIRSLPIAEKAKEAILGGNAARLLKLPASR
jgi:hypothetical protein